MSINCYSLSWEMYFADMINKRRVKLFKALIYILICTLLLIPIILLVICLRILFAIGNIEQTITVSAQQYSSAFVSVQNSTLETHSLPETAESSSVPLPQLSSAEGLPTASSSSSTPSSSAASTSSQEPPVLSAADNGASVGSNDFYGSPQTGR